MDITQLSEVLGNANDKISDLETERDDLEDKIKELSSLIEDAYRAI